MRGHGGGGSVGALLSFFAQTGTGSGTGNRGGCFSGGGFGFGFGVGTSRSFCVFRIAVGRRTGSSAATTALWFLVAVATVVVALVAALVGCTVRCIGLGGAASRPSDHLWSTKHTTLLPTFKYLHPSSCAVVFAIRCIQFNAKINLETGLWHALEWSTVSDRATVCPTLFGQIHAIAYLKGVGQGGGSGMAGGNVLVGCRIVLCSEGGR